MSTTSDADRLRRQRNAAWAVAAVSWLALIAVLVLPTPGSTPPAGQAQAPGSPEAAPIQAAAERPVQNGGATSPRMAKSPVAASHEAPPEPVPATDPLRGSDAPATAEAPGDARVPADPFTRFLQRPDGPEILNEQFLGEEADPAWAPAAERKIRNFVARHPYGTSYEFEYLECRSTLCRAQVSVDKAMLVAIQTAMGNASPVAGIMHDSLGQELEPALQAYGPVEGDPNRQQILLILERK